MRDRGELLEWAEYNGRLYGTPRSPVEEALPTGESVLLDIEVQGALQVTSSTPMRSPFSWPHPPWTTFVGDWRDGGTLLPMT